MEATLQQLWNDKWCASVEIGHTTHSYIFSTAGKAVEMLLREHGGDITWKDKPRQPKPMYDGIGLYRPFYD